MQPKHLTTYTSLGFKTIPVTYGRKAAPPPEWAYTDSECLWTNAPEKSNTALQAGVNNMFLLDPDNSRGAEIVKTHFDAHGINAFRVITWRGYTHYWVKTELPAGTQWNGKLVDNSGDWRGKNGYGLAAPSYVRVGSQYGVYSLPTDNPTAVPFVEWGDLLPLLQLNRSKRTAEVLTKLPIPTVRRAIPQWVNETANIVRSMTSTDSVRVGHRFWASRSEAVMSVLMSSLLHGYTLHEVMYWFDGYRTEKWWQSTAAKAVSFLRNEAERPVLERLYKSTYNLSPKDESVFRSMIAVLWFVGDSTGCVSNRDLQLLTARGRDSVTSSVTRLRNAGYVVRTKRSTGILATEYKINTDLEVTVRPESITDNLHQESFRHGYITPTAAQIIDCLSSPLTAKEIADVCAMSQSSVYNALKRLHNLGIVSKHGKTWVRKDMSTNRIDGITGAQDNYIVRKTRISNERSMYRRNRGAT